MTQSPLDGAWAAMHAEWTKLRTVSSTRWLLLISTALIVGTSATATSVLTCPGSCGIDASRFSLTGVTVGQAAIAVLAVLFVTSEYSTAMIQTTLAAVPRRSVLLAAKAAVLAAVVLATGAIAVLGSVLAGDWLLAENGFSRAHGYLLPLTLAHGPVLRAAAGSVLYLALIALFSLGIATAVRDSGAAIAVVLGLLYLPAITGTLILSTTWDLRFQRYAPMSAGLAIQATRGLDKLPIGPWQGLGVLGCWTAAALLAGWLVLRLRDA